MTNTVVVHQQRLVTRARVQAAEAADAWDLAANGERVTENLRLHGGGQGIADDMRADNATATRQETATSPGTRTFLWSGILGAACVAAVEQAPHNGHWSTDRVLAGFIVVGGLVWLIRYGLFALKRSSGRTHRAAGATASPTIGCGDPACPLEPCATYLSFPIGVSEPVDLDAELRALDRSASESRAENDPSETTGRGLAEIVHRPAPACPDCIATAWLDHRQPPGMVGLIIVHEPSCPYYAKAIVSSDQLI
jgi:hypothetical protein